MLLFFKAYGLACLTVAILGLATFLLMVFGWTLLESRFKRIITGAFIIDWLRTLKEISFSLEFIKGASFLVLALGLVCTIPIIDSMKKVKLEREGKCTCSCKACQKISENSRLGKAAVKYLGLDEDDISEILSSAEEDK